MAHFEPAAVRKPFQPVEHPAEATSPFRDLSGTSWQPLYEAECAFDVAVFLQVMENMIRNPNVTSSLLFRADILSDTADADSNSSPATHEEPRLAQFENMPIQRTMVRRLIPRNTLKDGPLDQTCCIYRGTGHDQNEMETTMVVYIPHASSEDEIPFYHPVVQSLAFLHEWNASKQIGRVSIHYLYYLGSSPSPKLGRIALSLLTTLHKHGEGLRTGYVKRVHHDTLVPQIQVQNTYSRLKETYARSLFLSWVETTDPTKHVFEDLGIAAFLIGLWAQMYPNAASFPGFVDIGCGNGLLVYILRKEGYQGWGFDARQRKSWGSYNQNCSEGKGTEATPAVPSLRQHVLLPALIEDDRPAGSSTHDQPNNLLHDGRFPKGTFIISNHADELTPWTPILATASQSPFLMIPCCSHALSGARYRAPPPKGQDKSRSTYSSLVSWVAQIAEDCGWEVETEMLRIPSTRNTGLVGRGRIMDYEDVDLADVVRRYGGADGFVDNVMKLASTAPRKH